MNRFETLLAPPSLKTKDLRIHLRMHPEIPQEISGRCSQELVNVATRLEDELLTVRFTRELATGPVPEKYDRFCARAIGAAATPIDHKFFAAFYDPTIKPKEAWAWVDSLQDPIQIQAWAAQGLRIASNAETEDPENAPAAWQRAVLLYERYFAVATVEDSCTYAQQTDPQSQETCRNAWKDFLRKQVGNLAARVTSHATGQRPEAFAACLAALALPEVARANPMAVRKAQDEAEDAVSAGIGAATALKAAEGVYLSQVKANPGAKDGLDRTLLQAMAREAALVEKGFGELAVLARCADHVGLRTVPDAKLGSLTRAAREEFYEAAAAVGRVATHDEATLTQKEQAASLLRLLPAHWVIGKGLVGHEDILRDEAIEQLLFPVYGPTMQELLSTLGDTPADSAEEEAALTAVIDFCNEHEDFAGSPQTSQAVSKLLASIFRNSTRFSAGRAGTRGARMMEVIADFLPLDYEVEIDDHSHSPRQWIELCQQNRQPSALGKVGAFVEVLRELGTTPAGSPEEEAALEAALDFAHDNDLDPAQTEALESALLSIFRSSASKYLDNPDTYQRSHQMMVKIARYLPRSTRTDFGGINKTLTEHTTIVRGLTAFKQAQQAGLGSGEERSAVVDLIDVLGTGIDFELGDETFRKRAQSALLNIGALNQSRGSSETAALIARSATGAAFVGGMAEIPGGKPGKAPKSRKPPKPRKIKRRRSSSDRASTVGAIIGILLVLGILIAIEWVVWGWTTGLGVGWQILIAIILPFLPSILYSLFKRK